MGKIDTTSVGMVIKTNENILAVCNLPEELNSYQDSVMISGRVYHNLGDDRLRGQPTTLTEV